MLEGFVVVLFVLDKDFEIELVLLLLEGEFHGEISVAEFSTDFDGCFDVEKVALNGGF